mgnify:CR=1 FL=1
MQNDSSNSSPKTITIVSDAWYPQVNGVVRTLNEVRQELQARGHQVHMITPDLFKTVPCPTYPQIRLAVNVWPRVRDLLDSHSSHCIHIATEGPLGLAARQYCTRRKLAFTSSFHTKFAEYIAERFYISEKWGYHLLRWFHKASSTVMAATPTLVKELESHGIRHTTLWTRGVDTNLFSPEQQTELPYPGPIHLYVGRIAVEKNLRAFLDLPLDGTKLLVGDGPALEKLRTDYPDAVFLGAKHGSELASYYASSDVFVFPSKTDTFGLVMLEALASGTPVAAYPVTGPVDVITDSAVGALNNDLHTAIKQAYTMNREACRNYAMKYSWEACATILENALVANR